MHTNRLKNFGVYRFGCPVKLARAMRKSHCTSRRWTRTVRSGRVWSFWNEYPKRELQLFMGRQEFYGGRVSLLEVLRGPAGNSRKSIKEEYAGLGVSMLCFDEVPEMAPETVEAMKTAVNKAVEYAVYGGRGAVHVAGDEKSGGLSVSSPDV